jgi:hypothetical protein
MRTTIDIDDRILKELKRLQRRTRRSLARLVSDLLAESLATSGKAGPGTPRFEWIARPMGARRDFRKFEFLDVRDPLA